MIDTIRFDRLVRHKTPGIAGFLWRCIFNRRGWFHTWEPGDRANMRYET